MERLDTGDRGTVDCGVAGADQHSDGGLSGDQSRAETDGKASGVYGQSSRSRREQGLSRQSVTQIHPEHCSDDSVTAHEHANVNNVRVDVGTPTLAVIMVLVELIGACGVFMGIDISD